MELYPWISKGKLIGIIGSGGDATYIRRLDESSDHIYLWISRSRALEIGYGSRLPIRAWLTSAPYIHARAVESFDHLAEIIAKEVRPLIEGKTLVVGFSGGKDSTALLLLLHKLSKYIDFKLRVVHVYIPIIDCRENLKFVDYVAKKLGIDIEVLSPKRREVRSLLRWRGPPRRGFRWCTYLKVKPMRKIVKDVGGIEVLGDRAIESPKRLRKLLRFDRPRVVVYSEKKLYLMPLLTLLDVVLELRRHDLVNPMYMKGLPRVSCWLCPYKALHEFDVHIEPDDMGEIEEVLRRDYVKRYSGIVSFEDYLEHHLWRFDPAHAKQIVKEKKIVEEHNNGSVLDARTVAEIYRSVWIENIDAPVIGFESIVESLQLID